MLFCSVEFIFCFLPVVLLGYYVLNRLDSPRWTKYWLLISSLIFYGWWNPHYLPLLISSIAMNYMISMVMTSHWALHQLRLKKACLISGITLNIVVLAYFKYANFFIDNVNVLFNQNHLLLKMALPLGISFFTIQQIAFLMDAYEEIAEERNFLDYALFVTFFPHLLAGPILHHKQMMPQFHEIKTRFFDAKNFSIGLFLFSVGLFKKVIVADPLSQWVAVGYALKDISVLDAWITSLSYTFQLYFDFSGYVDMAIGIAMMFNIRLPRNFNSPYQATSVINFWERWHITLSKFITTYIYTPIVSNFSGGITFYKSMFATLLAMFIAGVWHGAAWSYALFGSFHGVGLVINHVWRRRKIKIPTFISWVLTFIFVNISFVIFRADNFFHSVKLISAMFGFSTDAGSFYQQHIVSGQAIQIIPAMQFVNTSFAGVLLVLTVMTILLWVCMLRNNSSTLYERFQPTVWWAVQQVVLLLVPLYMMNGISDFVYFQF